MSTPDPATPCHCVSVTPGAERLAQLRPRDVDGLCAGCLLTLARSPEAR